MTLFSACKAWLTKVFPVDTDEELYALYVAVKSGRKFGRYAAG